jgi:hypothetical protein
MTDQLRRDAQRAYAEKLTEDAFAACGESKKDMVGFFRDRIMQRPDIADNPFVRSYMQNMVGAAHWRDLERLAHTVSYEVCRDFEKDVLEQRPNHNTRGDYIRERLVAAPYLLENPNIRRWVDTLLGRGSFQAIAHYIAGMNERQYVRQVSEAFGVDLAKRGSDRTSVIVTDGKNMQVFVAEDKKPELIRGKRMIDLDD